MTLRRQHVVHFNLAAATTFTTTHMYIDDGKKLNKANKKHAMSRIFENMKSQRRNKSTYNSVWLPGLMHFTKLNKNNFNSFDRHSLAEQKSAEHVARESHDQ